MCPLLSVTKWFPNFAATTSLPVAVYDPAACLKEGTANVFQRLRWLTSAPTTSPDVSQLQP